jgi:hypothetical protein
MWYNKWKFLFLLLLYSTVYVQYILLYFSYRHVIRFTSAPYQLISSRLLTMSPLSLNNKDIKPWWWCRHYTLNTDQLGFEEMVWVGEVYLPPPTRHHPFNSWLKWKYLRTTSPFKRIKGTSREIFLCQWNHLTGNIWTIDCMKKVITFLRHDCTHYCILFFVRKLKAFCLYLW